MAYDRDLVIQRAHIERRMLVLQSLIATAFCSAVIAGLFGPRTPSRDLTVGWIAGYHALYAVYALTFRARANQLHFVESLIPIFNVSCITAGLLAIGDPNSPLWAIYLYAIVGHTRRYTGRHYWSVAVITIVNAAAVRLLLDGGMTIEFPILLFLCTAMAAMAYTIGSAWRQAECEARTLGETDPLTGIPNRRIFHETLETLALNPSRSFALLMLDLDDFKRLNDQFGHQRGDEVLQTVARLLRDSIRSGDLLARYGGEEFIIALPSATLEDAGTLAERIRHAVHTQTPTSISIGCAVRGFNEPPDAVISRADHFLLAAKRCGKNTVWTTARAA